MSQFTFDDNGISDLHKDAYGFRPSFYFWEDWNSSSAEQKQATWDDLIRELKDSMDREKAEQQQAILRFTVDVEQAQKLGAQDRTTAIFWIAQAEDCLNRGKVDQERLEWEYGLPFGYLKPLL